MYIEYDSYMEFENYFVKLKGQYLSPGAVAKVYDVSRQGVNYWIKADIINAHRYIGKQGTFVIVPIDEFKKIDEFREKHEI